jgi:CheY-like chemotaxis protein
LSRWQDIVELAALLPQAFLMSFVLVVDDDSAVRRMILLLLSSEGYETETAKDGAEALALMRQRRPCLVLLDINMPLMDGWEFRKHQLADPALADVPVVGMTGIVHPEDVERILRITCLRKPVDFPLLIRAVEKFCRRSAS